MLDQNNGLSACGVRCHRSDQETPDSPEPLVQKGIDVHHRRLQEVQGEHRHLNVLAVGTGEPGVLAVEHDGVGGVSVLHHLQPTVDLAPEFFRRQIVAGEDRSHSAAEFLQGLVGGVFRAAAG